MIVLALTAGAALASAGAYLARTAPQVSTYHGVQATRQQINGRWLYSR